MLPSPSASFTLPSLYDDLEVHCRIYFPRLKSMTVSATRSSLIRGCAIFAHPYAPLGGSYDDPVVQTLGSLLLKHGLILITFNFRGAEKSAGKTSWSGKAELADYVSVYTFVLAFLDAVALLDQSETASPPEAREAAPLLMLGSYSYGSMITAHLPALAVPRKILSHAQPGKAEYEIRNRASELAQSFLGYCEAERQRRRSSLKASPDQRSSPSTLGGYDSADVSRRAGTSRRSINLDAERVRQSVDRVRQKIRHSSKDSKAESTERSGSYEPGLQPRLAYLLISPLLGTISNLATVFSSLKFGRHDRNATCARDTPVSKPEEVLSTYSSLVVFGSEDHFTSSKKVRQWCETIKVRPDSCLEFCQVLSAGHFWHDEEPASQMKRAVIDWLQEVAPP